jgi:hypothetical protein
MAGSYDSRIQEEVVRLKEKFGLFVNPRRIEEPATIVDEFGRILIWHLPGILSKSHLVIAFWL